MSTHLLEVCLNLASQSDEHFWLPKLQIYHFTATTLCGNHCGQLNMRRFVFEELISLALPCIRRKDYMVSNNPRFNLTQWGVTVTHWQVTIFQTIKERNVTPHYLLLFELHWQKCQCISQNFWIYCEWNANLIVGWHEVFVEWQLFSLQQITQLLFMLFVFS